MENSGNPRNYKRIYRRVLATLLLLAIIPLVGLGVFSSQQINTIYDEKFSAGIEALSSSKLRALETFITERIGQIRNLAFTHSYEELSDQSKLSRIFSVMQSNGKSFVDLGVIGLDGRHVAYVGPYNLQNANYHEAEWFGEVLHRSTYVSDAFLGKRQVPHFIIAVLRHDGERSFILRATIDMEAINDLLRVVYVGDKADAFIVSEKGILQTDSLYYGKSMMKVPFAVQEVRRGKRITLRHLLPEETGADGVVAALSHFENMPWILVITDDAKQALAPLVSLRFFILAFVLIGVVLITMGSIVTTRRLVSSIERKDREQADIDARLLQSSKMAALGKMAAGVAHEVNNPLMLIQENAGWITDLLDDEDKTKITNYNEILKSCDKINANVQRARTITQRMLGFGRRMNPGRAELMVNVVSDHVIDLLRSEAENHNVTIKRDYSPDVPVILSDPAQLEQVILNIVDNAIDAIGRDGTVTITTFSTQHGGAGVRISDTGPGLPPEYLSKIFDPFFTTKAIGEGTGLGLAICFSILEKLGGHIDVESELQKGTSFTVTLPPEPPQTGDGQFGSCALSCALPEK